MRKAKFLFLVSLFLCVVVLNSEVAPAFGTTIFSSGWENSGGTDVTDGGAWTAVYGSPTIVTSPVHHGSYAMQATGNTYVRKTFTEQTVCYVRVYGRANGDCGDNSGDRFFWVWQVGVGGGGQVVAAFGRYNDGGVKKWVVRYRNGATMYSAFSTVPYSVDTWYCMELKVVVSSTAGEYRAYLNGTEIITVTGVNSSYYGNINQIFVGNPSPTGTAPTNVVDCVVVADTYIGPEGAQYSASASQTVSFALSTAATQTLNRAATQTVAFTLTVNALQTLWVASSLSVAFSFVSSAELITALVRYASLTLTFASETSRLFAGTRNPILNIPLQLVSGKTGNFLRMAMQSLNFLWQSIAYVPGLVERAASLMITFTSGTVGFWVNPYYASKGFVFAAALFIVFVFVLPTALVLMWRRR